MVLKKLGTAIMLSVLAFNTTSACVARRTTEGANVADEQSKKKTRATPTTPTPAPDGEKNLEENLETGASGEIKELAAGGYSSVKEPFIVVARDADTYASLKGLHDKLPELDADFFKSNAVVAAFLGQRQSGGYSVRITRTAPAAAGAANMLRVSEHRPPKDAMVTMALTAAFRIVSVAVNDERPLALELDATWQEAARPYKVDAGEFTRMGGFAGRPERSTLKGDLRIMRHARLATVFFALQGAGAEGARALQDVATGTVAPDGTLTLTRLDPGSFVPPPRHPLSARGSFTENENQLSLTFEAMQAKVNDGFGGQGKLEAAATAPPKKKRAVDDDPM